jgi:hypothetical protein
MRKSYFLILIWLSVCGSAIMEAQAQPRLYSCSRSTIETYPEEEKRPVLQFLDEARALADRGARFFAEGRIQELYNLRRSSFRRENTEAKFREELAASEQAQGKILKYDYYAQSLLYGNPSEIDLQSDDSSVIYAVKTTVRETGAYLQIYTGREGKELVIIGFIMYFTSDSAAEPHSPQITESRCQFIEGPLKVKTPK